MRISREYRMVSKEAFELFIKKYPDVKLNFKSWKEIIYQYNYNFRDYLLESANKSKLPWGVGDFAIKKKKLKKIVNWEGKDLIKLPIDWKKTKAAGKVIYHFNYHSGGYRFSYKWFINSARFKHANLFVFKPYRVSSRLITKYIENGYGDRYIEWDSFLKKLK